MKIRIALLVIVLIIFVLPGGFAQTNKVSFSNVSKISLPDPEDIDDAVKGSEQKLIGSFYAIAIKPDKKIIYVVDFKISAIWKLFKNKDGYWIYIRCAGGLPGADDGQVVGKNDGNGDVARFKMPNDICIDGDGNLWVADLGNNSLRKIIVPKDEERALAKDYTVLTVKSIERKAGTEEITQEEIQQISTLDYNPLDNCVYAGGLNFSRIFKVNTKENKFLGKTDDRIGSAKYLISEKDANMKAGDAAVEAKSAKFTNAYQLCVDRDKGDVYFTSGWDHYIFKYDFAKKTVEIVAGAGTSGSYMEGQGVKAVVKNTGGLTWDPVTKGVFISCTEYRGPVVMYLDTSYFVSKTNPPEPAADIMYAYRAEVDWDGNLILPDKGTNKIYIFKR
jgi:hypothetical protein